MWLRVPGLRSKGSAGAFLVLEPSCCLGMETLFRLNQTRIWFRPMKAAACHAGSDDFTQMVCARCGRVCVESLTGGDFSRCADFAVGFHAQAYCRIFATSKEQANMNSEDLKPEPSQLCFL